MNNPYQFIVHQNQKHSRNLAAIDTLDIVISLKLGIFWQTLESPEKCQWFALASQVKAQVGALRTVV